MIAKGSDYAGDAALSWWGWVLQLLDHSSIDRIEQVLIDHLSIACGAIVLDFDRDFRRGCVRIDRQFLSLEFFHRGTLLEKDSIDKIGWLHVCWLFQLHCVGLERWKVLCCLERKF